MECSKCPPHSISHHEGSLFCGCEKNYFRAEGDPVAMACTRKCLFINFFHLTDLLVKKYLLILVKTNVEGWSNVLIKQLTDPTFLLSASCFLFHS